MYTFRQFFLALVALLGTLNLSAQKVQNITGKIIDEASRQPLTGAVIQITNEKNIGAVSDPDGNFKLSGVPLGRQTIRVTYTGYEERMVNDVLVTAGKEVNLTIALQEALHQLDSVKVTYSKAKDKTRTNNEMIQVSARSFNVDETKRYAGALGDPSRMAANFAGVVSGNDARNDIVVKGNSPNGMLWQLEGLNIPNPNHYGALGSTGGPVSMLNNNNIDKSDFLTSAFPAQYGNAVAGVFDMKLRDGNRNKKEFVAQIGFNGFELGAEGPLGKQKHTSYVLNYRYSTLGAFQKLGISFGTGSAVPQYQDLNFKVVSDVTKNDRLTFFGVNGNSRINFLGSEIDTSKTELYGGNPDFDERNKFGMSVTGVSWERRLSEKTTSKLTLGYAYTLQQYIADSLSTIDRHAVPYANGKFTTTKLSGVWSLTHKWNARNNMQAGVIYDQLSFDLMNKDYLPGGSERIYIDRVGSYGLAQAYTQWKHRFSNHLSGVAGLHGQYLTLNNSVALEPRASMRYTFGRQALGIGYGLHHQAQNVYTYYVETPGANGVQTTNKELGFIRSHHTVVTYDWNINEHMRLKAEAYYQQLGNVPVEQRLSSYSVLNSGYDFGVTDVDSLVNKGTGRNYGTEVTLERFFDKGYYFLVTGSLFKSQYKGSDGVERNTAFNTGYVLNALAGKEFKVGKKGNILALNLKVTNVGGRYTTPIDLAQSRLQGKAVYLDDKAFSQQQSAYFRTDLRVSYRKEYKKSTLEMAVDFQNLTNNQNIFLNYYDSKNEKMVTVYQQSFFPVPTLRYTF